MDHVDKIVAQWAVETPDLDMAPMALIGRLMRAQKHVSREMQQTFSKHELNTANFDLLLTLRRSGPDYALSPNDLMATTMVTSGTMTNRIDQLEKDGLVERLRNPSDGRGFIVSLTAEGMRVANAVLDDHVETQTRLVSGLDDDEREQLTQLLRKFLAQFEAG